MAKEWAKVFYKSKRWAKCRDSYIKKRTMVDGGMCEECHDKPGYIVHHRVALTPENISDPEVSLNHEKLEYVCKACHDLFDGHGIDKAATPLCVFDTDGQPVSRREA